MADGVVDAVATPFGLTSEVSIHLVGGHSAGHAIVRVDSGKHHALLVGHLALSPIHLTTETSTEMSPQHFDDAAATRTLEELRAEAATGGAILIGPLWPFPGAVELTGPDGRPVPVVPT